MKRWQKCLAARLIGLVAVLDTCSKKVLSFFRHSVSFMKTPVRRSHKSEAGRSQKTFLLPASTNSDKDTTLVAFSGLRKQIRGSKKSLQSSKRKKNVAQLRSMASQFPKASFLKRAGSRYLAIDTKVLAKQTYADLKQFRLSNQ